MAQEGDLVLNLRYEPGWLRSVDKMYLPKPLGTRRLDHLLDDDQERGRSGAVWLSL